MGVDLPLALEPSTPKTAQSSAPCRRVESARGCHSARWRRTLIIFCNAGSSYNNCIEIHLRPRVAQPLRAGMSPRRRYRIACRSGRYHGDSPTASDCAADADRRASGSSGSLSFGPQSAAPRLHVGMTESVVIIRSQTIYLKLAAEELSAVIVNVPPEPARRFCRRAAIRTSSVRPAARLRTSPATKERTMPTSDPHPRCPTIRPAGRGRAS